MERPEVKLPANAPMDTSGNRDENAPDVRALGGTVGCTGRRGAQTLLRVRPGRWPDLLQRHQPGIH